VIFITELDNLLTVRLLSPLTKAVVEKHSRLVASRDDIRYLAVLQKVFVCGVILVIFGGLFAEVHYLFGLSFFFAVVAIWVEGLAELIIYDSEQPLLTRVAFTLFSYGSFYARLSNSWICCFCGAPDEPQPDDAADAASGGVLRRACIREEHKHKCLHLMTVATQRRRRRKFCTAALFQDVVAFTIELYGLAFAVYVLLNVALDTAY